MRPYYLPASPWFACVRPRPDARLRLFCFPYAGGGASLYRSWLDKMPDTVEVVPIQLPGRETRFREPALVTLPPLVDALAEAISSCLDKPFAFFGHSMGALLAFEVARQLRKQRQNPPLHLFASGCAAPQRCRCDKPIHNLPDAEFLNELHRLHGTPREVLENSDLMELLLPMLRADFALCETYSYSAGLPLSCPITALGGSEDTLVAPGQLADWTVQTEAGFNLRLLPGGHFFLHTACDLLVQALVQTLSQQYSKWSLPVEPWPLRKDEVHVWRFSLDRSADVRMKCWEILSSDEKARARQFHFVRDQDRFIVGRGGMRFILGHYLAQDPGCLNFIYNPQGKPELARDAARGLRFNMAHAEDLALVAVTRNRDVGVDLEALRTEIATREIAARFFSPREQRALSSVPESQHFQAFFNCWTRKEAYLKATGKGLAVALDSFDVSLIPGAPAALLESREQTGEENRWAVQHLTPKPGYVGAVVARGKSWQVRCGEWTTWSSELRNQKFERRNAQPPNQHQQWQTIRSDF